MTAERSDGAAKVSRLVVCDRNGVSLARGSIRIWIHMDLRDLRRFGRYVIGIWMRVMRVMTRKMGIGIFRGGVLVAS